MTHRERPGAALSDWAATSVGASPTRARPVERSSADTVIHTADVVLPITSPPIEHGGVVVHDGAIVAVGHLRHLQADHPRATVQDHVGVLMPGLVNAHSHLQYTSFATVGQQVFEDYTAWSVAFIEEYDRRVDGDWAASSRLGVKLSLAAGVTCLTDIVTDYEARDVLVEEGIPGVAYLELIGIDWSEWEGGVAQRLRTAVIGAPTVSATSVGISPHAPYSLDRSVLEAMGSMARELGVRLHIHVGESDGEEEYYRHGTGSLADRLRVVAARPMPILEQGGAGIGTTEFVDALGLLGPNCHLAHGVYLGHAGRQLVAQTRTLVALCPRSNRIVGVDHPPVADFLREAVPFAVGTDSLGSSPSLDLLDDVATLAGLAVEQGYVRDDLDRRLLCAATMGGATALGLDDQLGSLEPGKRADLAVFLPNGSRFQPTGSNRAGRQAPLTTELAEEAVVRHGAGTCSAAIVGGVTRWTRDGGYVAAPATILSSRRDSDVPSDSGRNRGR